MQVSQPATDAAVFLAFFEKKVLAVDLSICLSVEQNVLSTSLKWDISIKLSSITTDPMSTANVPPKPLVNLYGDSELPPYFEEIVEPKSFRNRLINVLIWTTLLPLILLLFFLQKNFETATDVQNNLQLGVAREAALYVESDISNIRSQLSLALSTYSPETPLSRRSRTFENLLTQNSSIRSLSYTDETGFTTSLRNSQPLETPQHSLATRVFTLNIDQPGTNGILHRTLTASVDISMLAKDFANLLYGQSYSGAIFNADRQLIYAISSNSHYHNAAYDPLTPIELTQLHESKGEPFLLRTEGDRFSSHIKAFVPIGPMGWTLVISQAQQTRDEAMRETAVIWALGFFAALAGTFFLGSFMAVPITRSFDSLVASVENYGKTGHFTRIDKMLAIEGTTELVKLEETFARMAQSVDKGKEELQKANLRLEDEVQARTSDLVARNEELKTLQTLLAPLSSAGHFMPKTSVIFYCIERFRVLLELSSLVFETEISTPAPHNSIDVRLGSTVYGRLLLPQEAILTADKRNSLERLAYALAIVSANAKLVEHLSQEQAALQTVFESMTDGVVIIGKSGLIRYANEYAGKLLNEGDSVLMLMFSDIMTSNWESITGNRITDDLQNKTKTRVRSRIGGNRVLELLPFTVSDMPGLAGERTGWILRDITQEVSLEAVKENIVGVVAHELKTPLTLLQLQVRDLTRTIEHGQMPSINDVRDLSDETIHLGQLVDDLLDVSRIRAGAMKLNVRVVHVASLIDRAEKLAAARYPMKVSRHIDMDAELFCVDPDRLTQVFVNLFNNAARYKKPTQEVALIDVSTRIDGQQIVIDITDQGIGIAPGKAKHIFDQFYQADMTASRSHSGSGLGLTIVRGIIHAHGGTIAVHFSNPEFGTRFTLRLPLSMPPELI
mgnify:FL=1